MLNRALHAFALVSLDPHVHAVSRRELLVARVGYGAGEEVADGRWRAAVEVTLPRARTRRARVLEPQAQLAAVLGGRRPLLVCEELTLHARSALDQGHDQAAALLLAVALDTALAELPAEPQTATVLGARLAELRAAQDAVTAAAGAARAGVLSADQRDAVAHTLQRLESALRARAAAIASA